MFHSYIDRLLVSIEKMFENQQPRAFNDELLTNKEVANILKVSRRTLQDYRNNGILPYILVGGKILYYTVPPMCNALLWADSRRLTDCEIGIYCLLFNVCVTVNSFIINNRHLNNSQKTGSDIIVYINDPVFYTIFPILQLFNYPNLSISLKYLYSSKRHQ